MTTDWAQPQNGADLVRDITKRLGRQERRTDATPLSDLLGPGIGATAIEVLDWNGADVVQNGFYYSTAGALNAPQNDIDWAGTVIARADGRGTQEVWDPTGTAVTLHWVRVFAPSPSDGRTVVFEEWKEFATHSGKIDFPQLDPGVVTSIEDALEAAEEALGLTDTITRVFRQATEPIAPHRQGDLWFNTADGNHAYVWDTTANDFIDIQDALIDTAVADAAAAQTAADQALSDAADAFDEAQTSPVDYARLEPDAVGAKHIITGSLIQTTTTAARGVKLNGTGLIGYDAAGVTTFFLNASTGDVTLKGSLTTGSSVTGATITGGTVQTTATAARGIKITTTGLTAYDNAGVAKVTINATTGVITTVGSIFSGGEISGSVVTGGTVQTETTAARGLKMTTTGLVAYDASGNPTLTINAATGAIVMKGELTSGSTITGAVIKTALAGQRVTINETAGTISFYSGVVGELASSTFYAPPASPGTFIIKSGQFQSGSTVGGQPQFILKSYPNVAIGAPRTNEALIQLFGTSVNLLGIGTSLLGQAQTLDYVQIQSDRTDLTGGRVYTDDGELTGRRHGSASGTLASDSSLTATFATPLPATPGFAMAQAANSSYYAAPGVLGSHITSTSCKVFFRNLATGAVLAPGTAVTMYYDVRV